ncbi:CopG family transcriptional regulator [Rhizobium freirei]|nr:CopG family transcriptional regulator [Rhizobium freirei]
MIYIVDIVYWGFLMRTLVDIGDLEVKALDRLAQREKMSRAALIRKAIDDFLARNSAASEVEAFGLWGDRKIDGLAYQDDIRGEW